MLDVVKIKIKKDVTESTDVMETKISYYMKFYALVLNAAYNNRFKIFISKTILNLTI